MAEQDQGGGKVASSLSIGGKLEPLAQTRNPGVWPPKRGLRAISIGLSQAAVTLLR